MKKAHQEKTSQLEKNHTLKIQQTIDEWTKKMKALQDSMNENSKNNEALQNEILKYKATIVDLENNIETMQNNLKETTEKFQQELSRIYF